MTPPTTSPSPSPSAGKTIVLADVSEKPIPEVELVEIYRWLDSVNFSRSKKSSTHRDFADGVMMAELVAAHIPSIVDLLNYIPGSATTRKRENWERLNSKVFRRIRFQLTHNLITKVINAEPEVIERILYRIRPILELGIEAVVPQPEKAKVKPRFLDARKKMQLDEMENESPQKPPPVRSTSFSYSANAKSDKNSQNRAKSEAPKKNPFSTSEKEFNPSPRIPLSHRPQKKIPRATSPPISPKSSATDSEGNNNNNKRNKPSTANPSRSPRPKSRGNLTKPRPQSAISDYSQLRNGKPRSKGNATVSKQKEKAARARKGKDTGDNEDEVYDEIYCDSAPTTDDKDEEDEEEVYDSEEKITKRKIRRVRKYEYREDYIFNGMTVGSTTYCLPLNKKNDVPAPNTPSSNSRAHGLVR